MGLGFLAFVAPLDQPRHPLVVIQRLGQRHASLGFPLWAARQDRPSSRPVFEALIDHEFGDMGDAIQHLLAQVVAGQHPNAQERGSMFRALARDLARNLQALRRRAHWILTRVAPLGSWDGPRRTPRRQDALLVARAVAAWESQRQPGTG